MAKTNGDNAMRFAVAAKYKKLCAEFDQCTEFAIMDVRDNAIVTERFWSSPPHEFGNIPEWLRDEMKVDVVIANNMRQKISQILTEKGVQVVTGADVECPRTLVEKYLGGFFKEGAYTCAQ
jgi:predicted Fe-Mo cluster-binding NifX family protein